MGDASSWGIFAWWWHNICKPGSYTFHGFSSIGAFPKLNNLALLSEMFILIIDIQGKLSLHACKLLPSNSFDHIQCTQGLSITGEQTEQYQNICYGLVWFCCLFENCISLHNGGYVFCHFVLFVIGLLDWWLAYRLFWYFFLWLVFSLLWGYW